MQDIFREIKRELHFKKSISLDFSPHVHEDIELVYVKRGGGAAFCDGKRYELMEGDYFLVFPNQVHHYAESAAGEYLVLIIKPSSLLSYHDVFLEGHPVSALCRLKPEQKDNIGELFDTAQREFVRDGYSPVILAYVTVVLGKLLRFYTIEKNQMPHDTVLQILQYCATHYRDTITVGEIADRLHLSRSCVSHIFSDRLGIHFCDYINGLRLSDAAGLLKNRNYSVTEVAGLSGFPTIRTFNRAFLKQYGISPSEYRKSM